MGFDESDCNHWYKKILGMDKIENKIKAHNTLKIKKWLCPKCNKYSENYPALSRRDNKTDICSNCGLKEALDDYLNRSVKNDDN